MITARYPDGPDADDLDEEVVLIPSPRIFVQDRRADLNRDGAVDLADLSMLLASFGTDAAGDVDEDGDTDLSDLALLLGSIVPE